MGCCIGEKHSNWCQDNLTGPSYPPVYIDKEGNEYCIFHAPAECKFVELYDEREGGEKPALMSGEDFNQLVFDRIQGVIDAGEDEEADFRDTYTFIVEWNPRCNFAGTIFPYTISFSLFHEKKNISLPPISFQKTTFLEQTFFDQIHFTSDVYFGIAIFERDILFKGTLFNGYADFNGANFLGHATFGQTTYNCGASFLECVFAGQADFEISVFKAFTEFNKTLFKDEAIFEGTKFHEAATFTKSIFDKEANFNAVQFRGLAYFENAYFHSEAHYFSTQFRKNATFSFSVFSTNARFDDSQFRGDISFLETFVYGDMVCNRVQFRSEAILTDSKLGTRSCFQETQFRADAYFSGTSLGETHFNDSESRKKIYFDDAYFNSADFELMELKGPAAFNGAHFNNRTSFKNCIFSDYTNFEQSSFKNYTSFKYAHFKEWTYFKNVIFEGEIEFAGAISKETILIESTKLFNLKLSETNIESFQFTECTWPTIDGRKAIYDEIQALESDQTPDYLKLEEIYRRLQKIARQNNDEVQTSAWHYKEKDMSRKRLSHVSLFPLIIIATLALAMTMCINQILKSNALNSSSFITCLILASSPFLLAYDEYKTNQKSHKWFPKIYLNIYRAISGYGEEPLRAFLCLILFIVTAFFMPTDLLTHYKFAAITTAAQYLPIIKISSEPLSLATLAQALWRLLITIQAALFAFALRNKLRR